MKMQRLLIALTVVNLGLLIFLLLSHIGPALATSVAPAQPQPARARRAPTRPLGRHDAGGRLWHKTCMKGALDTVIVSCRAEAAIHTTQAELRQGARRPLIDPTENSGS